MVIASIDLAAGGKPTFRALVTGVRSSPWVFVPLAVHAVLMELVEQTTHAPSTLQALALATLIPSMLVVLTRGDAWVPFIVDKRLTPIEAFRASWTATRGSVLRICAIYAVTLVFAIPAGLLTLGHPLIAHVPGLILGPMTSVLLAEVYLELVPSSIAPVADLPRRFETRMPATPPEDLPTKGSGWTRDTNGTSQGG